jgi:hypothetical protein
MFRLLVSDLNVKDKKGKVVLVPDRLCGLVVRVPAYRPRGPVVRISVLERGPLSLVRITEELPEWKNCGSGLENKKLTAVGIRCADHAIPSVHKSWH